MKTNIKIISLIASLSVAMLCLSACGKITSVGDPAQSNELTPEQIRQDMVQIAESLKNTPYVKNGIQISGKLIHSSAISTPNGQLTSTRIIPANYSADSGWIIFTYDSYVDARRYLDAQNNPITRESAYQLPVSYFENSQEGFYATNTVYFCETRMLLNKEINSTSSVTTKMTTGSFLVEDITTHLPLFQLINYQENSFCTSSLVPDPTFESISKTESSADLDLNTNYNGKFYMLSEDRYKNGTHKVIQHQNPEATIYLKTKKTKVGKIVFDDTEPNGYKITLD